MNVIGQRLHAVGETLGIDDDSAVGSAAHLPAIVDVHELVAGVFHSCGDDGVGDLTDEFVADVAAELVPTVPAHGRCGGNGCAGCLSEGVGGKRKPNEKAERCDPEEREDGVRRVFSCGHEVSHNDPPTLFWKWS